MIGFRVVLSLVVMDIGVSVERICSAIENGDRWMYLY